jgi:hypothetical protein
MFSYVSPEQRVPVDHPLRAIREFADFHFDSIRCQQGHYLGDRRIVVYTPSATVLYLLRTTAPERRPPLPMLAVGGPGALGTGACAAHTLGSLSIRRFSDTRVFDLSGANMKALPRVPMKSVSLPILAAQEVW